MRAKLFLMVMAIVSITAAFFYNQVLNQKTEKSSVSTNFVDSERSTSDMASKIVNKVSEMEHIPSVEEIELDLLDKSNTELKLAIEKNNNWAREKKFVALANANRLDSKSTSEFLKYIRLNNALNKILIERQIEEIERIDL